MLRIASALLLSASIVVLSGCNDGGGSSSSGSGTTPPPPQAESWTDTVNGQLLTFEENSYVQLGNIESCDLGKMAEFSFDNRYGSRTNPVKVAGVDGVTSGSGGLRGTYLPQNAPGFEKTMAVMATFLAESKDKWIPKAKVKDNNTQEEYTVQLSEAAFAQKAETLFHYSRIDNGNEWSYVIEPGACPAT